MVVEAQNLQFESTTALSADHAIFITSWNSGSMGLRPKVGSAEPWQLGFL
jgi:hypothetical protein